MLALEREKKRYFENLRDSVERFDKVNRVFKRYIFFQRIPSEKSLSDFSQT